MKIETKFDVTQKVFFLSVNEVKEAPIIRITVEAFNSLNEKNPAYAPTWEGDCAHNMHVIKYKTFGGYTLPEDRLFATKEELLSSL